MSDLLNDSDYLRAQCMYDAQEPPEYSRKTCPKCRGDGEIEDEDGELIVCNMCLGNGEI